MSVPAFPSQVMVYVRHRCDVLYKWLGHTLTYEHSTVTCNTARPRLKLLTLCEALSSVSKVGFLKISDRCSIESQT